MKFAATALAFIASALAASPAFATAPDFKIKTLQFAGSGCPAGTVAGNVAADNEAFTLLFDSYLAEAGPGLPLSASRKNCQLLLTFDCPAGYSFALVNVDTRGFASLDYAVTGTQKTSFYFQGSSITASLERTFYGEQSGDYQVRDTVPAAQRTWGACGRNARALNINTSVRVDNSRNRNGQGLMTVDSLDGSLLQTFAIEWQRTTDL